MSTVFNRVFAHCKNNHIPLLSQNKRHEIGALVYAAYRASGIKKWLHKKEKQEPDGIFKVLTYPKEFTPQIDAIISNYILSKKDVSCETMTVKSVPEPVLISDRKTRKRIPVKPKLERSAKPSKIVVE